MILNLPFFYCVLSPKENTINMLPLAHVEELFLVSLFKTLPVSSMSA
jgi:hypothetical protein